MYKCDVTGKNSKEGEKLHKVIAVTRPMTYYKYVKNEDTREWQKVEAGKGFEPVLELNCSREGEELWLSWSAEEREVFLKHR